MPIKQCVIPAIDDLKKVKKACKTNSPLIFLMKSNICNLKSVVSVLHQNKKSVYVHIDFIEGFKSDKEGLKLLKNEYKVDGIVSANAKALSMGQELDLKTIYRLFLIDSISLKRSKKVLKNMNFTAIEVLPAINALKEVKMLKSFLGSSNLIAGGFVRDVEFANQILKNGFQAVDSSDSKIW